jgi:hypothetical protein
VYNKKYNMDYRFIILIYYLYRNILAIIKAEHNIIIPLIVPLNNFLAFYIQCRCILQFKKEAKVLYVVYLP